MAVIYTGFVICDDMDRCGEEYPNRNKPGAHHEFSYIYIYIYESQTNTQSRE